MDDRGSISGRGNDALLFFSPPRPDHPDFYPMGSGGKVVRTWSWPLISSSCRGYESMELYLHYRKSSSRRGAQLCRGTQLNTW